jgi:hypothetical protein
MVSPNLLRTHDLVMLTSIVCTLMSVQTKATSSDRRIPVLPISKTIALSLTESCFSNA